jgi:N,N'-diacetylchitobiose transport system permease protein
MAVAEVTTATGVTRVRTGRRRRASALPYILLVPATVLLAVMLGYPLVRLVTLSLQ